MVIIHNIIAVQLQVKICDIEVSSYTKDSQSYHVNFPEKVYHPLMHQSIIEF